MSSPVPKAPSVSYSDASTLVESRVTKYSGPKTTFSLERGNYRGKATFRLVDVPARPGLIHTHSGGNMANTRKPMTLGAYSIDFVKQGKYMESDTVSTSSRGLHTIQNLTQVKHLGSPTIVDETEQDWGDLELETEKFLLEAPVWQLNGAMHPIETWSAKPQVRRRPGELIVRLMKEIKPGVSEIADIHMSIASWIDDMKNSLTEDDRNADLIETSLGSDSSNAAEKIDGISHELIEDGDPRLQEFPIGSLDDIQSSSANPKVMGSPDSVWSTGYDPDTEWRARFKSVSEHQLIPKADRKQSETYVSSSIMQSRFQQPSQSQASNPIPLLVERKFQVYPPISDDVTQTGGRSKETSGFLGDSTYDAIYDIGITPGKPVATSFPTIFIRPSSGPLNLIPEAEIEPEKFLLLEKESLLIERLERPPVVEVSVPLTSGPVKSVATFASVALASILDVGLGYLRRFAKARKKRLRIPKDHVRVRWTCKCGKELFDDYFETRPGAARGLQDILNRPKQRPSGSRSSSSASPPNFSSSDISLQTRSTAMTSFDSGDISNASLSTDQKQHLRARQSTAESINSENYAEELWLLACAERQKFATKLSHFDMNRKKIRSDMDLALMMKDQYLKLRPRWRQYFRLRGLSTIKFVQFELHRTHVVDIRKCPDVPPKSDHDYTFLKEDLVPPVGEEYLMHLFHHPECGEDECITYERIPKYRGRRMRVKDSSDIAIGWGIHLVEGFQSHKIWALITSVFVLGSLVFAILWTVKMKDVQGAFGVSAYICAVAMLILGCLIAYLE